MCIYGVRGLEKKNGSHWYIDDSKAMRLNEITECKQRSPRTKVVLGE